MTRRIDGAWRLAALAWSALLASSTALGCGSSHSPQIDSETHFLRCDHNADCAVLGDGFSCVQGFCREAEGQPSATITELPYASSGARIKALHYVADGAVLYRNLHDDALDVACDFAPDQAGEGMHCIPSATRDVIYLDSACQEPALAERSEDGSGMVLSEGDWVSGATSGPTSTCAGAPRPARAVYRLGERVFEGGNAAIGKTLPAVYARTDNNCEPTNVQVGLLLPNLFRLEPADLDQLVAGTASTLDVGNGLQVRRVVAEDGAEKTLAVLGRDGQPCSPQSGGACVPEPVATPSGGYFLDGECKNEAFFAAMTVACGAEPLGVRVEDGDARVFALQVTHSVFIKNPGAGPTSSCDAFAISTDEAFVSTADVTDSFPRADAVERGDGELHVTHLIAPGDENAKERIAAVLDPGTVFTDARGDTCQPREIADGSARCIPDRIQVMEAQLWRGSGCSERLFTAIDESEPVANLRLVNNGVAVGYGPIESVSRVEPYSGAVYALVQTGCQPATPSPTTALYFRGAELPLSDLPRIEPAEL